MAFYGNLSGATGRSRIEDAKELKYIDTKSIGGTNVQSVLDILSGKVIALDERTANMDKLFESPTLTGVPKAPTAAAGTNTTQIATTAFVQAGVAEAKAGVAEAKAGVAEAKTELTNVQKRVDANSPLTNTDRIYVDGTNGSDSTGNGTSEKPYKSINYALSTIPKNLNGYNKYIMITGGTYNEEVVISGFCNGYLNIIRNGSGNVIVKTLSITYCFGCIIRVSNFQVLTGSGGNSDVRVYCATAELSNITLDNATYGTAGFYCRHCDVQLSSCVVSGGNGTAVLAADNGKILVLSISGSCTGSGGTGVGFQARTGGQICIGSSSLTATTLYKTSEGGRIYSGAQASAPNY